MPQSRDGSKKSVSKAELLRRVAELEEIERQYAAKAESHRAAEEYLIRSVRNLSFLSRAAMRFVREPEDDEIFQFIADQIYSILRDGIVIVNEFDPATGQTIVRAVSGEKAVLKKFRGVLGGEPVGLAYVLTTDYRNRVKGAGFTRVPGGLHDLAFRQIPPEMAKRVEEALGLGDIHFIPFSTEEDILGTVAVLTFRGRPLGDTNLVKAFVHQAAVALQSRKAQQKHQTAQLALIEVAKFPGENPNPVMRVSRHGKILYANPSSAHLLDSWHIAEGGRLPDHVDREAAAAWSSGHDREFEAVCGDVIYSMMVVPVRDAGYVNIYGRNITARKKAEERLILQREEIDRQNEELQQQNEELRSAREELQAQNEELRAAEANLEESRQRYADLYEFAPVGYFTLDRSGMILEVNRTGQGLLGFEGAAVKGRHFGVFLDDDGRKKFQGFLEKIVAGSGREICEVKMNVAAGEIDVELIGILTPYKRGGQPDIHLSVSDVTFRKRAEAALRRLNEELEERVRERTAEVGAERRRFYDVLETLPVYVVLLTADYRVPFANRFFRERFGESHGKRCYEYLFNRTEPCENCETYKALDNKAPHRWEWTGPDGHDYDIYDFPFMEADGSMRILEMGIDFTERKRAEAALRRSEKHYRTLFEQMFSGFALHEIITDGEGKPIDYRFLEVNPVFEKLTGLSADKVIGRTVRELIPDIESFWIERYGHVALTGESIQFDEFSHPLGKCINNLD